MSDKEKLNNAMALIDEAQKLISKSKLKHEQHILVNTKIGLSKVYIKEVMNDLQPTDENRKRPYPTQRHF